MQTGQTQRAFDLVCQNLAKLGAISLSDFLTSQGAASPSPAHQLQYSNVCAETNHGQDNSEVVVEHASRFMDAGADETVTSEGSDLYVGTIENACRSAGTSLYWAMYSQDNWAYLGVSDHTKLLSMPSDPQSYWYLVWGAALKIRLGVNDTYIYSTDALHHDPPSAKAACAQFAVEQGILDHIKAFDDEQTLSSLDDPGKTSLLATKCVSLRDFYTTLSGPRPLPVPRNPFSCDFDFKTFLNTLISEAKGARLSQKWFYWVENHLRRYQRIPGRHNRLMANIDSSRLYPTA